ncbi:unnamed protein product [Kuraishia capsulata CBS 1993]|uniref:Uncharacterized protein n=1 Tax=Kuraishia capsulata CBS 1993 TaxID=1382522 RepID=W6MNP1_9ASCO|nr:uncharacterized protein KUCA_T00003878001 [Kuraishia capsulata CBS 1993]CDK27898.1 unnamed protein product [Kuraishia capsulata CBS 1993]
MLAIDDILSTDLSADEHKPQHSCVSPRIPYDSTTQSRGITQGQLLAAAMGVLALNLALLLVLLSRFEEAIVRQVFALLCTRILAAMNGEI